jgi:MtfA peptidase
LWHSVGARLPFLAGLDAAEQSRLRELCTAFLASKEFSAPEDFPLTDEICLSIAVQGCLPILHLGLEWYRGWQGIVVYPDEFVVPREITDEHGIVHRYDEVAAGEAWEGGPLILSWSDVQMTEAEYNVVIHEFAHKLDMLNGDADGCPPLQQNQSRATWQADWRSAYEDFCQRVDQAPLSVFEDERGEVFEEIELDSALDPYAAEAPGEFFAVASEVFFTAPAALVAEYPEIYGQLAQFYRQDPAARLTSASA